MRRPRGRRRRTSSICAGNHRRYGEAALKDWARAIREWRRDRDVFVYFDNDIKSAAPQDAEQLIGLLRKA